MDSNHRPRPYSGIVLVAEMILGADEETRTPDILHGKQVLYQLSYIRICLAAAEITLILVFTTRPQGALRGLLLCFNTEATDSRYQEVYTSWSG